MRAFFFCLLLAVPVPPNAPVPIPNLAGACTWGSVAQDGRTVVISGDTWTAEGTITGQTVKLRWRYGDKFADGEYRIESRVLVGSWSWRGDDTKVPERIEIRDAEPAGPDL